MDVEKLTKLKQLLDSGAITQEEFEQKKAELMGASPNKKGNIGLIVGIAVIAFVCMAIIGGSCSNGSEPVEDKTSAANELRQIPEEFKGECPISVTTSMYDNIIGMPELKCSIKNNTNKDIVAIKLHFEPKNVYGEDVNSIFTAQDLYTDDTISAGGSITKQWQMIDTEIKSGNLYIYSVYFADGTEWGNKDAAESDIKKYGHQLSTKY